MSSATSSPNDIKTYSPAQDYTESVASEHTNPLRTPPKQLIKKKVCPNAPRREHTRRNYIIVAGKKLDFVNVDFD
jgi:hypothetical protein